MSTGKPRRSQRNNKVNATMNDKSTVEEDLENAEKETSTSNDDILQMLVKMNITLDNLAKGQTTLESKLSKIEVKLNTQEKSIADLENSVDFTSKELEDLKIETANFHKGSVTLQEQLDLMQAELLNLQRHSRGFNLRFIGIAEPQQDKQEDCVQVINDLIKSSLGISVDIENAHRVGRKLDKPRHIIARFLRRPERYQVLMKRKVFKDQKKILVVEDLTKIDLQLRRQLSSYAQEAYQQGKRVRFSKGTLFIDKVKFIPPNAVESQESENIE